MWLGFRSTIPNLWSSSHRSLHLLLLSSRLLHHHFKFHTSLSHSHSNSDHEFLLWLQRKSGTEISSALSIGNSAYGRSLFASKHIKHGDCILKVPFTVQLTPEALLPEINSMLSDNIGSIVRLAIVILVEQKIGQNSEWAPYISSLPRPGELHSTIFWSEEELAMVQPSPVYQETIKQKIQIKNDYFALRPVLDKFPQFFYDITFSDFMHAYALVGSRAWGSSKGLSLIPFADFLNHDGVSKAILLSDDQRQLSEVVADHEYAPGDEVIVATVLIRYGKFPNSTLLLDFGFTLPYNIHDEVQIWVNVPQDDPLHKMKLELLHKHPMPNISNTKAVDSLGNPFRIREVRSAKGKGKGIPQSLRAFVRISCVTTPEELKALELEAMQKDGRLARWPLSDMRIELEAHQILLSQVCQLIADYDAIIKSLRLAKSRCIGGKQPLRRQMAQDLLSGELRILTSASTWLSRYCASLSKEAAVI